MRRTVVHNPKNAASGPVGFLIHDLAHEPIHRSNSAFDFAATEDFCAMDIPSGQIGPGTFAEILMLDAHGTTGSGSHSRLLPPSGLNAGLLIRGNYIVVGTQRSALPDAFVEIEDWTCFVRKVGIAREDPASMLPGTKGIAAEPAPERGPADLGDQALRNYVLSDFFDRESGQGEAECVRQFAGQSLNLDDETGGKSGLYARREAGLQDQACGREKIACATC